MAYGLVLQFEGVGRAQYDAVNKALGIDPAKAGGPWPAGLLTHAAGPTPAGWVVIEVWDAKASQQKFMADRLGAALAQGGVNVVPQVVETDTVSHINP
jgi:hypothetical protein